MKNHFNRIGKTAFVAIATALLIAPQLQAKPTKTVAKKPKTVKLIREVLGTEQLTGYEGALGETFTLGKTSPFNFTLRSLEYSISRVNIGTTAHFPKGDEKLLVLHFTLQSPRKTPANFTSNVLKIRAVDANGLTREYVGDTARETTGESLNVQLQPGQKVEVYTAIRVAAFGEVPKLIVGSWYEPKAPVVRYDLRGKAKKLASPFAAPSDKSGATALKTVPAKSGVFYPVTDLFDMKMEKIEYSNAPLNRVEAGDGRQFCVATFSIKNRGTRASRYSYSYFRADLKDADGEKTDYTVSMLKGSRDEEAMGELGAGEEARVRFYWPLPVGVKAQSVLMQYGYDRESRTFAFAVPQS